MWHEASRPIRSTMWIRSDDRGWCNDLICGAFWIGANSEIMLSWHNMKCYMDWKECGRNQFEVISEIVQMIDDDVMTQYEVICEFEQMIYDAL
jgi:hypothetical protein